MLAAFVVLSALAVPAFAWTVDTGPNGSLNVSREASDTGAATFTFYQSGTAPTVAQYANGSYDETSAVGSHFYGASPNTVAVDANSMGFALWAFPNDVLLVFPDGRHKEVIASMRTSQPVYLATSSSTVQTTATVFASIVGTVPVSSSATLSLTGTAPVDAFSATGVEPSAVGIMLILGFVALGFVGTGTVVERVVGYVRSRGRS